MLFFLIIIFQVSNVPIKGLLYLSLGTLKHLFILLGSYEGYSFSKFSYWNRSIRSHDVFFSQGISAVRPFEKFFSASDSSLSQCDVFCRIFSSHWFLSIAVSFIRLWLARSLIWLLPFFLLPLSASCEKELFTLFLTNSLLLLTFIWLYFYPK